MSPFRHLVARAYDWGVRTAQSLVVMKLRMTNTHPSTSQGTSHAIEFSPPVHLGVSDRRASR